jgi:hypothetical protein
MLIVIIHAHQILIALLTQRFVMERSSAIQPPTYAIGEIFLLRELNVGRTQGKFA